MLLLFFALSYFISMLVMIPFSVLLDRDWQLVAILIGMGISYLVLGRDKIFEELNDR